MRAARTTGRADPPRLRVLVCPHDLITGGSQISAIDLAARIRDRGHDVEIYAPPGPLQQRIADHGLAYRPAPPFAARALRPRALYGLAREVRRFRPDIVHSYESPPAIAAAAVSVAAPHRSVVTVLSMEVPDFIPDDVPLIVGTAALVEANRARAGAVRLMEPPVDPAVDSPRDADAARAALGIAPDRFVVAVVGRLSAEHEKAQGVIDAIRTLDQGDRTRPTTLLVAGTGDREADVRAAAAACRNPALTVRMEGNVEDPRTIYAAADVVLGMGSSAIRALAHARPVIVQGTGGFWRTFAPETVDGFLAEGFFGHGPEGGPGLGRLIAELRDDPARREALGAYGRQLVLRRYGIDVAAAALEDLYRQVARDAGPRRPRGSAASRALARYARFRVAMTFPGLRRAYRRLAGRHA